MSRLTASTAAALFAVVLLIFASTSQVDAADDINTQWNDVLATLSDLRSDCQPRVASSASPSTTHLVKASPSSSPIVRSSSSSTPSPHAAGASATPSPRISPSSSASVSPRISPSRTASPSPRISSSATPSPRISPSGSPSVSPRLSPSSSASTSPRIVAPSSSASPSSAAVVVSASPSPAGSTGLKTVTVGPGQTYAEPADVITKLAPGFTMTVLAGTYIKPFDIPNNLGGWTINGAGGGKTIFDGRGGGGSGHSLYWGKGFVHTQCPGTLNNIVFVNCGGGDDKADGEAGVYAELFTSPGTVYINKCLFQHNENGIFVPATGAGKPGDGIAVVVTDSDFVDNGVTSEGGSHDLYIQGDSYTETNCNHYGSNHGNNIKVRSPVLSVTGGFHANTAGSRWIDFPNGGTATVKGGVFTISPNSGGGNIIGYAEEHQDNGVAGGMSFTGSKLYIGRSGTQIMVYTGGSVNFDQTTTLSWTGANAGINVILGGSVNGIPTTRGSSPVVAEPTVPPHVSGNYYS